MKAGDMHKTKAELVKELERLRQAQARSEERHRTILNSVLDGIVLNQIDDSGLPGAFIEANDAFCSQSGYTREELRRLTVKDLVDPLQSSPDVPQVMETLRREGQSLFEMTNLAKDGRCYPVEVHAHLISWAGKPSLLSIVRDVSERRRAEQTMRESEERFRRMFDYSPVGAVLVSPDFLFLRCNEAFCRFLGYDETELQGKSFLEFTHPDDLTIGQKEIQGLLAGRLESAQFEKRYVNRGEAVVWGEVHIRLILDSEGRPLYFMTVVQDITARKRAELELHAAYQELEAAEEELRSQFEEAQRGEKELRESEERFRQIFDFSPVGIVLKALDSGFLHCNEAFCRFTGYDEAELLGKNFRDITHPDDLTIGEHERQAMKEGRLESFQVQKRYVHCSGATIWGDISIRLLRDQAGRPLYFLNVIQDITERKQADLERRTAYEQLAATEEALRLQYNELKKSERELRESEERFRDLAVAMSDPILTADSESGRIIEANAAACTSYGYTHEEMLGLNVSDISADPQASAQAIKEPSIRRLRRNHKRKNGEIIPLEIFQFVYPWQGRMVATALLRDLTRELRVEEERRRSDRLESVGLLAGGIAHDFNNILMGILGNVSLARMALANGREAAGFLEDAEKASLRARDLTKQLLTFARGGAPIKSLASLKDVIEESAGLMLRGSNVDAATSYDPDLWPVNIDVGQMSQVFNNLIINAMQAMPGGGTVNITAGNVEIGPGGREALQPGSYVRVVIADRGVGISTEDMPRIFDAYYTTKPTGSGLGLATAYSIIKQHGGSITAQSSPGQGTAFTILLPASQSEVPEAPPENGPAAGRGRVLLIDDDDTVLRTTSLMLQHLGYTVATAREGREGIEEYLRARDQGFPFDAVIMDLTVPGGMGGKETARELLKLDPAARAVVASGYSQDQVLADFQAYGFKGVLAKPYRLAEISRVLQKVLEEKQ